ncbi:MAG: helix-turn-helix domain-containing protein [Hyphomicrobium sp.]
MTRVGDRWTGQLLIALGDRRMRFGELHRAIEGISQRMLTVTLRHLERDGLIVRTVYATVPPRVEYELSDRGRSLRDVLRDVGGWVVANKDDILRSRLHFDEYAEAEPIPIVIVR